MAADTGINASFRRLKARIWERTRVPHAYGYNAARWFAIERDVRSRSATYGSAGGGFDERAVEYPWMFDRMRELKPRATRVLDAGSILNHSRILAWWREAALPPVSIFTQAYEGRAEVSDAVHYEFGDLRQLPYRDEWFSVVLCLSVIEHVGLDNTVYGAAAEASQDPGMDALRALAELRRVTAPGGTLLLSFPYGKRAHRGWFRILDEADLRRLTLAPGWSDARVRIFRSLQYGWREVPPSDARDAGYNEPTGGAEKHTAPPWVAGAEAVALVEMQRA
jgi:SAM-dependent methyltransferase